MQDFQKIRMKAQRMAYQAHAGRKYGGKHYVFHLYDVALVLADFGFCPERGKEEDRELAQRLAIAAYLHDLLEDTDFAYEDIRKEFGAVISDIVWAVTDEPGPNRRMRHLATYPKIAANHEALILKLADRIANMRNSQADSPGLFRMYLKELPEFRKAMRIEGDDARVEAMWRHLDALAGQQTTEETGEAHAR